MGLAEAISKAPETFADVARRYSDDPLTRDEGGSLGGIKALDLFRTPTLLDALAVLQPGESSRVVETQCGFHILQRRVPPAEAIVSGSRIVIGHDSARWLHRFAARRAIPPRSQSQARGLAWEVYERARAHPEQFSELVSEYSEHRDALDDGDLGQWSTHEPSHAPREIELLQSLEVGEVAPPIEGLYGFEILRRTPNTPRRRFAMEAVQVFFDAEAAEGTAMAKSNARRTMTTIVDRLASASDTWAGLRGMYCCQGVQAWPQGRASRELESLLESLAPGEIANRVIEWSSSFVLAKRVDSSSAPAGGNEIRHELPSPESPDVNYLLGSMHPVAFQAALSAICDEFTALDDSRAPAARALEGLNGLGTDERAAEKLVSADQRVDTFVRIQRQVQLRFGDDAVGEFQRLVARHLERLVLERTASPVGSNIYRR